MGFFCAYWFLDGSDTLWQWSQFHMGAQPFGPFLFTEWETQGQPTGQSSVSVCVCVCVLHLTLT